MSDETQQPIIIKRIKKGGAAGHGGAWKIAYADFVTAMMAFFLLMWLLGSTAKGDLNGIADFFNNPLKIAQQGGDGAGDASSVINGGGQDLTRTTGQVKRGDVTSKATVTMTDGRTRSPDGETEVAKAMERLERAMMNDVKGKIDALVEATEALKEIKDQLLIDMTEDGLRIQIVDKQNRPMFDSGSDHLRNYADSLLRLIGSVLNDVPNAISLTGHTDSSAYAGGQSGFSNWELSANRANASRRALVAGGLNSQKIIQVIGLADTQPFQNGDPTLPINRRIAITVLNRRTEQSLRESMNRKAIVAGSNTPGGEPSLPIPGLPPGRFQPLASPR